jgi:hypothetical protein
LKTGLPSSTWPWLLLTGLAAGALYLATVAPTLLWGDSAGLQLRAYLGAPQSGSLGHPLWILVAHLFSRWLPAGDAAWRANVVSSISGAAVVTFVALIIYQARRSLAGAILGSGVLAVSHTFWLQAVIAEVYTLHLCLVTAAAWLIGFMGHARYRWTGTLAWFLLGLSIAVHLLTIPLLPAFVYLTMAHRPTIRQAATLITAGLLGLVPFAYWELTAPPLGQIGSGLAILTAPLSPAFWPASLRFLALGLGYWGYQFLWSAPVGLWGITVLTRQRPVRAWFWLMWTGGSVGFAWLHQVPDQYVFYLPAWAAFAVFCGLGYDDLLKRFKPQWLWPAIFISALVAWGLSVGTYRLTADLVSHVDRPLALRSIPHREAPHYFLWPPKSGETGARRYVDEVFAALPSGSLLLADWTLYAPLRYAQQVESRRPDVEVLDIAELPMSQADFLRNQPPSRPLYLADANRYYAVSAIEAHFDVRAVGVVYAVERVAGP